MHRLLCRLQLIVGDGGREHACVTLVVLWGEQVRCDVVASPMTDASVHVDHESELRLQLRLFTHVQLYRQGQFGGSG